MKNLIAVLLCVVTLAVSGSALGGSPNDPRENDGLVESPWVYSLVAGTYVCEDDPAFTFTLDPRLVAAKQSGCRTVSLVRRIGILEDGICTATECCRWVWITGPNGWPIAILDCEVSGVRCPAATGWPTPPRP